MVHALKSVPVVRAIHPQHFAAPRGSVGAQAKAVQREGNDRVANALFGQHRPDMGMVVLQGMGRNGQALRQLGGELRAVEVGVQVVGHGVQWSTRQCQQGLH